MEEEIKQKVMQHQHLHEQFQKYQEFLKEIETKVVEIASVIESLNEISTISGSKKMLVPLANGIFLKTELSETAEVIVNVGAGVCVHKSIPETTVILNKRLEEVQVQRKEIIEVMEQLILILKNLEGELENNV